MTPFEAAFARFYPIAIVLGSVALIIDVAELDGWRSAWRGLIWLVVIPLWTSRYLVYRRQRHQTPSTK